MDILSNKHEDFRQPAMSSFGLKERRIEDVALRKLLSEWKQRNQFPRSSPKSNTKSSNFEMRSCSSQDTFLLRLKTETTSPDVVYEALPSPEFKPGMFYRLPRKVGKSRNYEQKRTMATQCFSSTCSRDQLCRGMKRMIFCEVMEDERLCFDCNGREVRTKFNSELNNVFPYLEYDQIKRPYGFCPRAIRLTEPLPIRGFTCNSRFLTSHGNCDCTRTKSALLPRIKTGKYEDWFTRRSLTNWSGYYTICNWYLQLVKIIKMSEWMVVLAELMIKQFML